MALSDAKASVVSCIGLRAGAAGIASSGPVTVTGNQIVSGSLQVGGVAQLSGGVSTTVVNATTGYAGDWLAAGKATILSTGTNVAVADVDITANSLIVVTPICGPLGPDATATSFAVELNPGVGFVIHANAQPTVNVTVAYAIMKF